MEVHRFFAKKSEPRGLTIYNGILYIADVDVVEAINISTGKPLFEKSVTGAVFLNDICVDSSGSIYVTDTQKNCIFSKSPNEEEFSQMNLKGAVIAPNGILYEQNNNRLLIVTYVNSGKIQSISLADSSVTSILNTSYDYLDGLTKDIYGHYYISEWDNDNTRGKVIRFNNDFDENSAQIIKDSLNGPADIYYCGYDHSLYIPTMGQDSIINLTIITPAAPKLTYPKNNAQIYDFNVEFVWDTVDLASKYELQVSKLQDFSTLDYTLTTANSFTTSHSFELNTVYYWRIRAVNFTGNGEWSEIWAFTTGNKSYAPPTLIAPDNHSVNQGLTPKFIWTKSAPNIYDLQISKNVDFTDMYETVEYLNDTVYTLDEKLKPNMTYYWRVNTYNGNNKSDWSEVRNLTTYKTAPKPPVLVHPGNYTNVITLTPEFSWVLTDNTTYYKLQISKSFDFSDASTKIYTINPSDYSDRWKITDTLEAGKEYHWHVLSGNEIGESDWSSTYIFTPVKEAGQSVSDGSMFINNISIQPNPANEAISLDFSSTIDALAEYSITNIIGTTVLVNTMNCNAGDNTIKINCNFLPSGVYFLKIKINNSILTEKFIIDKQN